MVNETTTKNYKYVRGLVLEPIEGIDEYRNNNKELQARKGLLVVVNRIDLSVKIVAVLEPDKHSELITECVRAILRRAEQLREAIESGKPPAPEPGVWCSLCPYWRECRVALGRSEPFAFVKRYFDLTRYISAGGRV